MKTLAEMLEKLGTDPEIVAACEMLENVSQNDVIPELVEDAIRSLRCIADKAEATLIVWRKENNQ